MRKQYRRLASVLLAASLVFAFAPASACAAVVETVNAVSFVDANNGYIAGKTTDGKGFISRTTNGGTTWSRRLLDYQIRGLSALDLTTAWATGWYQYGAYLTTNSGSDWVEKPAGTSGLDFRDIEALPGGVAVAVGVHAPHPYGDVAAIWRTDDSGATWAHMFEGPAPHLVDPDSQPPGGLYDVLASLASVDFEPTGVTGWAVGTELTRDPQQAHRVLLYKTSNGGSDWTTQTVSAGPYYANAVSAPSATVAWVGGTGRKVERTINGGTSWENVSPEFLEVGSLFDVQALYAWDDQTCVAFSSTGAIAKTKDGGATWALKPGGVGQELRSVSFTGSDVPSTSIGYAVGGNRFGGTPTVLKSTNGGDSWTSIGYGPDSLEIEDQTAGIVFDRWVTGFSGSYSAGTYVYGRWTNTELEAKFKGTKVRWIGPKQPSYGMADVYIDGVKKATVDCYAAAGSLSETIFESATLANTYHVLEIRLTGAKNAASSGNVVVLDRFEVEGVAPSGVGTRLNEQGSHAAFMGTWIKAVNPTYTSKTYTYSAWSGTTYSATFTGTKVAWIGPKSLAYGKANVYIDGVLKGTVDCYSSATGWRYRIWESTTLSRATHTIQIKPTRTKNTASTNYVVVVDALDVAP